MARRAGRIDRLASQGGRAAPIKFFSVKLCVHSVLLTPKIPAICDEFGYAASLVRTSALAFRAAINAVTTMRPRSER